MAGIARLIRDTFEDFGSAGNIPAALGSTFVYDNAKGFSTVGFCLSVPTGGSVAFEGSFDGTNFVAITLRSISADGYVQNASVDEDFIGSISGLRKFRIRVTAGGSAAGSIVGRATEEVSTLEGQEHSPSPDKFGHEAVRKIEEFSAQQTGAAIWTPETGKRYIVTDLIVSVTGVSSGTVALFDQTNTAANTLFKAKYNVAANQTERNVVSLKVPFKSSAVDNVLKLTTSAAIDVIVQALGYESE